MIHSKDNFLSNFSNLSHPSKQIAQQANLSILQTLQSTQIWFITKQLLLQSSFSSQLIGTQILHQKITQSFHLMSSQHRIQLKNYVFSVLYCQDIKLTPIINKLASISGIIVCQMIQKEWKEGITEIVEMGYKHDNSFRKTVVVLQEITEEWKNSKKSYEEKIIVKEVLLGKSNLIVDVLRYGFKNYSNEMDIIKLMRCMRNWAKYGLRILQYTDLVQSLLANTTSTQLFKLSQQILSQSIKLIYLFSSIPSPLTSKQYYTSPSILSLSLITTYISQYYLPSLPYSYLIKFLITYNLWILFQSQPISQHILKKQMEFVKSKDLDISYSSLEFWIQLVERSIEVGYIPLREMVEGVREKVLEGVVERLKGVGVVQREEEDIELLDEDRYMVNITGQEYQLQCSKLVSIIYRSYNQSDNILIKTITSLLQQSNQNRILLGLFLFKSILKQTQNTPQISQIVNYILQLSSNISPSLKIESFRILMNLDIQSIDPCIMFNYIKGYFTSEQLSQYAINTYQMLIYKQTISSSKQFILAMIQFLMKGMFQMTNSINIQKVCSITFQALSLSHNGYQQIFRSLLPFTITFLFQFEKYYRQYSMNGIILVYSIVKYFQEMKIRYPYMGVGYFIEYCNKVVGYLFGVLTVLKEELYYKQDNQFYYVKQIYIKCLFLLGPILTIPTSLLTLVCQLIHLNLSNIQLLSILTSLLPHYFQIDPYSPQQTLNSQLLGDWVQSHLSIFNTFLYKTIVQNYDPDIIRVFFNLQLVLLKYDMKYVEEKSVELGVYCLRNVYEEQMLREVMKYFYQYLYYLKNQEMLKGILKVIIPLQKVDRELVGGIVLRGLSCKGDEFLIEVYEEVLRGSWKQLGEESVGYLARVLSYYTRKQAKIQIIILFEDLEYDPNNLKSIQQRYQQFRAQNE